MFVHQHMIDHNTLHHQLHTDIHGYLVNTITMLLRNIVLLEYIDVNVCNLKCYRQ